MDSEQVNTTRKRSFADAIEPTTSPTLSEEKRAGIKNSFEGMDCVCATKKGERIIS